MIDASPAWIPDFADRGVIAPIDELVSEVQGAVDVRRPPPALPRDARSTRARRGASSTTATSGSSTTARTSSRTRSCRRPTRRSSSRPCACRQSWAEFNQTAQFITDQMGPKVYGTALAARSATRQPVLLLPDVPQQRRLVLRPEDDEGADQRRRSASRAMQELIARTIGAAARASTSWTSSRAWATWLQGKSAMIYSWPPTGRISENYAQADKAFSFLPKSKIVGKVGYAVIPGKNGEHAGSFVKCVSADSKNIELAYLNAQWMTSPSVSLQRVMLPYTLRDPVPHLALQVRRSTAALWPGAKDYLIAAQQRREQRCRSTCSCPGAADYANALDRAMTGMYAGRTSRSRPRCRGEGMGLDHATARSRRPACGVRGVPHAARGDAEEHGRRAWAGREDHVGGKLGAASRRQSASGHDGTMNRRRRPRAVSSWMDRHIRFAARGAGGRADPASDDLPARLLALGQLRQLRLRDPGHAWVGLDNFQRRAGPIRLRSTRSG